MALQLILGNAGSGKTEYLYEYVISEALKNPDQKYLVLVPEQFTIQTQREYVLRHPGHCIMNIDVLSFERLAYRVFDELGLHKMKVLEDTGKILVLRNLIQKNRDQLKVLKYRIEKPGYLDEIKSLLSELVQYGVSPEKIQLLSQQTKSKLLQDKLEDIYLIYQEYENFCRGKYITAEKLLTVLTDHVKESILIQNSVMVFDGYTGFTPVQNELMKQLLNRTKNMLVTAVLDPREDMFTKPEIQNLFYMSKKMIQNLYRLAKETQTECLTPVWISGEKGRFQNNPQLAYLERNLFRNKKEPWEGSNQGIYLAELDSPQQEVMYAARVIAELVREKKMSYRDIAVVTADLEGYGRYAKTAFDALEIPFYLDEKKTLSFHPVSETLQGAFQVAESDYSYAGVFRFLKGGLSDFTNDEIDTLENYCLAHRITGRKRWHGKFQYMDFKNKPDEEMQMNEQRDEVLSILDPFVEVLQSENSTVREKSLAVFSLFQTLQTEEKLNKITDYLEKEGDLALAKAYSQIYKSYLALLDKLVSLMGDEKLSLTEYREIFEAGMKSLKIGTLPQGNDCVIFGDIERTRLENIKYMIFLGVNDGLIPRISGGSVCLSQAEREELSGLSVELAPTIRERAFIQQFYLYLVLTKASRGIYLTYSDRDSQGGQRRPSYLVSVVKNMFPGTEMEVKTHEEPVFYTPNQALQQIVADCGKDVRPVYFYSLFAWFWHQASFRPLMEKMLEAAGYAYHPSDLNEEVATALFGQLNATSISRLEKFASCPYSHFLNYGLGLRDREDGSLTPAQTGTILHEIIRCYGNILEERQLSWNDMEEETRTQCLNLAIEKAVSEQGNPVFFENARNQYQLLRLKRIISRSLVTLERQAKESGYLPVSYEISFHKGGMIGKIDRIDCKDTDDGVRIRVIDYKSGNKKLELPEVYAGRQLQLLVYLHAAKELISFSRNKPCIEDGAYYFHIDDPMITLKTPEEESLVEEKIYENLRLTGISSTGGNEIGKDCILAGSEALDVAEHYALLKAEAITKEIKNGNKKIEPFQEGNKTGCDYCPYQQICRFDESLSGYHYQTKELSNDEEIWGKMTEEVKGDLP